VSGSVNIELLRDAASGNHDAFARIMGGDNDRLRRMVEVRLDDRLRSRVGVSDIVQETWLTAFSRLEDYLERQPVSFFVWLRMVAAERIIDAWRTHAEAEKRSLLKELPIDKYGIPIAGSASIARQLIGRGSSPSEKMSRRELCDQVESQLALLSPADREILVLRHLEELTIVEASEVLCISASATSNRYLRALHRLRERMKEIPELAGYWGDQREFQ